MMLMTVLPVPHRSCDHLEPGWEPEGQHDLEEMHNMTTNKYLEHSWQYCRMLSSANSLVSEVKWQMQCNVISNTTGMRSTRHHRSRKKQTWFLSEVLRYPQLLRKLTQSCHVLVRAKPFLCTYFLKQLVGFVGNRRDRRSPYKMAPTSYTKNG